uniref:Macrocin o-methyltransferase n=1 Tax=Pithovirus LCPAC104 TaxID=2506589 RepID=A0A481Z631_9VIRU|nr:MAG: macrocin o-methyltransferase [Pithovirus LCPAC104]
MDCKLLYIEILKKCVLDTIYGSKHINGTGEIIDKKANDMEILEGKYWPSRAHSMLGIKRIDNIQEMFDYVINNKIEGDLLEAGVWRGGAAIFMAGLNKCNNQNRKIFVADSFEGLPKPDSKYESDINDIHHTLSFLAVSLEDVKSNFKKYNLLDDNVIFIKGFFENSLKSDYIEKLAILRVDGDMYSSTIQVLDNLYDKVSKGGVIIIDDYALKGCKDAVDYFRSNRNINSKMIQIDWTGMYWIKE